MYGFVVRFRQGLFISGVLKSHKLPVPLVVVGNVVAGGAGKTPLVMALVLHLKAQGIQVGVISRGFGARRVKSAAAPISPEVHEVLPNSLPQDVGDEPLLIRRTTGVPVFTGVKRYAAGQALLARHPETQLIISDDGLQHLALQRDLEVVVFDDRGLGNGWLLPAGPLREPWPRPCDLVLHTSQRQAFGGFGSTRTLSLQARNAKGDSLLRDTLAGFAYVANHRGIRFVMILLTATSLLVRPVIELLPSIADKVFQAGPTGLSMMLSAIGVGAVTASLVLARRGQTQGLTKLLVWSTFGTGLCVAAALQAPSINVAAVAFCLMGVCMLCGNVSAQTLVQNAVSSDMRARVLGLFIVFGHGLPALGALMQGWLATFLGLPMAVGGSAVLMLSFWVWALFAQRRMMGELEGPSPR